MYDIDQEIFVEIGLPPLWSWGCENLASGLAVIHLYIYMYTHIWVFHVIYRIHIYIYTSYTLYCVYIYTYICILLYIYYYIIFYLLYIRMYNSIYAWVSTARGISMPWTFRAKFACRSLLELGDLMGIHRDFIGNIMGIMEGYRLVIYITYISVEKWTVLCSLMIYLLLRVLISRSYVTLPKGILSYMWSLNSENMLEIIFYINVQNIFLKSNAGL
jgi:hypothetical protein